MAVLPGEPVLIAILPGEPELMAILPGEPELAVFLDSPSLYILFNTICFSDRRRDGGERGVEGKYILWGVTGAEFLYIPLTFN